MLLKINTIEQMEQLQSAYEFEICTPMFFNDEQFYRDLHEENNFKERYTLIDERFPKKRAIAYDYDEHKIKKVSKKEKFNIFETGDEMKI